MVRRSPLGIIAGGGALPLQLANAATRAGSGAFVIRIAGLADPALRQFPGEDCGLAEVGKMIRLLRRNGCKTVALAGDVKRPDFSRLIPDLEGAKLLPRIIKAAAVGDGALLSTLVEMFEGEGLRVLGADEVLAALSATQGALGGIFPDASNWADIRTAAWVVAASGPFDVGQGAVVSRGLVLAIEAAEGTDAMLRRCAALSEAIRGGARSGVLVKRPKPDQERRVDLPTIGAETVRLADMAGLAGIAIEAAGALVMDFNATIREADERGLFVYGFTTAELTAE